TKITVINNSNKVVRDLALEILSNSDSSRRWVHSPFDAMQPGDTRTFSGPEVKTQLQGNPSTYKVRIIGVRFANGENWGAIPPPPPPAGTAAVPPPAPVVNSADDNSQAVRRPGGMLSASATRRVQPSYPPLAMQAGVSGAVMVEVTINEEGEVIAARALSGHPLLQDAAIEAARQWTFSPTMVDGKPVKVVGAITFNFSL